MIILHVITAINRGGAENHLIDLIRGQVEIYGCKVVCAYLKGDGYWRNALERLGVVVVPLGLRSYGEIKPLLRLRCTLQTFSPDLVHAHLAPAELYVRAALMGNSKLPLVITQHNEDRFYRGLGHALMERWVIRRACCIIAISQSVGKFCALRWPAKVNRRLRIIHHGINSTPYYLVTAEEVALVRRMWGVNSDALLVGAVAQMIPRKGLESFIDGFAAYTHANGVSNAKLVLVGAGPLEQSLRRRVEAQRLGARVIWAGFREDIPVVMHALDIFVLNSISEGFGLVLLEAMLAGRPVIASNICAIPEIVIDGVTGILVPPQSPMALADALCWLAAHPELRKRYGEAGKIRVQQHFQLGKMFHNTMACYQTALNSLGSDGFVA